MLSTMYGTIAVSTSAQELYRNLHNLFSVALYL